MMHKNFQNYTVKIRSYTTFVVLFYLLFSSGLDMGSEKHLNFRNVGLVPSVPNWMLICTRTKQEGPQSCTIHAKVPIKSSCFQRESFVKSVKILGKLVKGSVHGVEP